MSMHHEDEVVWKRMKGIDRKLAGCALCKYKIRKRLNLHTRLAIYGGVEKENKWEGENNQTPYI